MVEWIDEKWIESLLYAPHQCYRRFKDSKERLYTAYLRWRHSDPWQFRIMYGDGTGCSDDFEFITVDLFEEYGIFIPENELKLAEKTAETLVEELFSTYGDLIDIVEECKNVVKKKLNGLNPEKVDFELASIESTEGKTVRGVVYVILPGSKHITARTTIELEETPFLRLKKILETKYGDKIEMRISDNFVFITIKARHFDEFVHYVRSIDEYIGNSGVIKKNTTIFYNMVREEKKDAIKKSIKSNSILSKVRESLKEE